MCDEKQVGFKTRVRDAIVLSSKVYLENFVGYEYLLCSEAFKNSDYYIVCANKDNYKHLTGVNTRLSAEAFFDKAVEGTLSETDFDFYRKGQAEREVKGSVRRKISVLPEIGNVFSEGTKVEENFERNRIRYSFAAGTKTYTLGFTVSRPIKPLSLLKGNCLDEDIAKPLDLVLRRKNGEEKFNELILGNRDSASRHAASINGLISEKLSDELFAVAVSN
ncbi:MAG: PBECR4 domain-containing protein [Oscillospiraceae bacterium]|nr:PBECR4 domain-containing protein [Oscillospiraceae bacterium]